MNAEEPGLPPLARSSLAEGAAELLRERIIRGSFGPGARLVEVEIARQLGISRAPVREALAMLRAEGLARDDPGHGTYVTVLDRRDVEEVYEVRAAIESGAARLVIDQDDPQTYAALEAALEEMRKAAARGDRQAFVEADLSLHGVLCSRSGNARLYRMWETQTGLMRALIRLETERLVSTFGPILEEHENFVAEIRSREPDRASAAAWSLFRRTSQVLGDGLVASPRDEVASGVMAGARSATGGSAA